MHIRKGKRGRRRRRGKSGSSQSVSPSLHFGKCIQCHIPCETASPSLGHVKYLRLKNIKHGGRAYRPESLDNLCTVTLYMLEFSQRERENGCIRSPLGVVPMRVQIAKCHIDSTCKHGFRAGCLGLVSQRVSREASGHRGHSGQRPVLHRCTPVGPTTGQLVLGI